MVFPFLRILNGPSLYAILDANRRQYQRNFLESSGDRLLYLSQLVKGIVWSTSIFLVPYLATKIPLHDVPYYLRILVFYHFLAYSARTMGRLTNADYRAFISIYSEAISTNTDELVKSLRRQYDYQITPSAPVSFVAKPNPHSWYLNMPERDVNVSKLNLWFSRGIAYLCVHSFGRRMLYPGSFDLLKTLLFPQVLQQRLSLILYQNGERFQLRASDGNIIDGILFDKRDVAPDQPLIICCDGNGGFYETGITRTPINLNFSVIGWNPPGFSESTGEPYPLNILNSMDAVMQFALSRGFKQKDIILFGWSIGGFPATWAAANYPQVRGLILDASFDDVLPLALAVMPSFAETIVRVAIEEHFNLNVAKQLARYNGPVKIIRRFNDEVVTSYHGHDPIERRRGNRGNYLLAKFLRNRYPELIKDDEDFDVVLKYVDLSGFGDDFAVARRSLDALTSYGKDYILANRDLRAHLIRLLCRAHFTDLDYNHVTPLKPRELAIPQPVDYTDLNAFLDSFPDLYVTH